MSPLFSLTNLGYLLTGLSLLVLPKIFKRRSALPLPPGPNGLPIIGNVLDMPAGKEWLTFAEWGRKWGGIVSVKLLGQPMIIVNSAEVMEQLDKNGSIYSDRPRLEMGGELVGYAKTLVLMPYNNRFRNFRRHVSRLIGSVGSVQKFYPMEELETRQFLKRVLANTEDLGANLRKTSGAIIMKLTYGIEVQEKDDPFVTLIEHANDNFSIACTPGLFLVDVFPALRHVPHWFLGAGFKKLARDWAEAFTSMVEVPYAHAKSLIAAGSAPVSFLSTSLESDEKLTEDYIDEIKHTAASLYGAGADTTVSAQHAFFLAMLLHPDVQRKAQAEIDTVVGTDRLPNFSDRARLPYINAVVTEALRWNSVAPTGVPHRAMEDAIVNGYLVPKGSIIITNLWYMLHNPDVYPEPFNFDPSRHIETPGQTVQRDPRHACFGYARRICAGMHLAEASLFICIAMSLAVFDITPALDDTGAPIIPVHENTSGIISHPETFKYNIKPRSEQALALISADVH